MRSAYLGLVSALCWAGVLGGASPANEGRADMAMAGRRLSSRGSTRHRNTFNGTAHYAELGLRQQGGQCGAQAGRCPGDLCCSSYGFCGDSIDHCHPLFDCQAQYGVCGWPRAPPVATTTSTSTTPAPPTSTSTSTTTTTTPRPPTTSTTSTTTARPPTSTSTPTVPIPTGQVTTNGQCGNGTMCIGNPNFGPCCSQFFWCGSSLEFCGAGCRSEFGACLGVPGIPGGQPGNVTTTPGPGTTSTTTTTPPVVTPPTTTTTTTTRTTSTTTTSAAPSPTVTIPPGMRSSTDGTCGTGVTCLGSRFGRCCSQFGYCGDGDQYCPYIVGCQPEFGYCDPPP